MKRHIDYSISLDTEIQRELERDRLGVEVPYMAEAYKEWMRTTDGKKPSVSNTYMNFIKTVDKEFFLGEEDFFYLLPQKIKEGNFLEVTSLFEKYLKIINDWLEYAKEEYCGYSPKVISDYRSGFKNYRRFIEEWVLPRTNGKKTNLSDMKETTNYKRLFAEDGFYRWLIASDKKKKGSAQSYISQLKQMNRILSKAISDKSPKFKGDILGLIPKLMKEQKGSEVIRLLEGIDEKLTQKIHANDTSLMPILKLRSIVSALRSYTRFFIEEYIYGVSGDEESTAEEITEISQIGNSDNVKVHDYPKLEANFYFRLITQDRISNSKDIFFPIGMIYRLFRLSEIIPIDGVRKGEYAWFRKWVNNYIAEIQIVTDKGTFIMADLNEYEAITINTITKEVTVTLLDGETARMLTPTEDENASPRFMEVDELNSIHIDHTPLISKVLSDNIEQLPTMVRLTEIMRKTAEVAHLPLISKNFSSIEQEVEKNKTAVAEMLKALPKLKDELELVRSESTLCLMAAKYNLRKK